MKKLNKNYGLAILALALASVCVCSVIRPVRFADEKERREKAVKACLVEIRLAEERYRKAYGIYAASFDTLVARGLLADTVQYIPYTEHKRFDLSINVITRKSGRHLPLMECGAKFSDYLQGLDENAVMELIENAEKYGRYPGLRIGDITTPNNNAGNWE